MFALPYLNSIRLPYCYIGSLMELANFPLFVLLQWHYALNNNLYLEVNIAVSALAKTFFCLTKCKRNNQLWNKLTGYFSHLFRDLSLYFA